MHAKPIKGIAHMHHFVVRNGIVQTFELSKDCCANTQSLPDEAIRDISLLQTAGDHVERQCETNPAEINFVAGDWCAVEYDGKAFPGCIKSVQCGEYEVSVMVKAGKYWKWPQREHKIFYQKQRVLKRLQGPELVNARGHYAFTEMLLM